MTLQDLNSASPEQTQKALLACCGSLTWANMIVQQRPFPTVNELLKASDEVWWSLDKIDWLEAFSKHPKIGDSKPMTGWSSDEQRGMDAATQETARLMVEMNRAYQQKFGWIFVVCATGKSAEEMLELLNARLRNTTSVEIAIAAAEQAKIIQLRLRKLVAQ